MDLTETGCDGVSGMGSVAGSCEYVNKLSSFINGEEAPSQQSDY
jgi:hypothetical protein